MQYLGLEFPKEYEDSNAVLCMTENCAVVIKNSGITNPLDKIVIGELEEMLSSVFGYNIEINIYVDPSRRRIIGTNPEGEIPQI